MFWSGQSFEEEKLKPQGKFKAAEIHFHSRDEINSAEILRWLDKAIHIQWDYKKLIKRNGILERLK